MIRRRFALLVLAARTTLAVVTARCVLRLGGFSAALRCYSLSAVEQSRQGRAAARSSGLDPAGVRIAFRVLRLPVLGTTCLPTSLALARVLRRRGAVPELVIGVASEDGDFSAHAWVEVDGYRLDVSGLPPADHQEIGRFRETVGRS
jgi:hypothetical protein